MPPGPPPSAYQPERRQLAEALRLLRAGAGLTGTQFAERAGEGWTQSRVSKIENLRIFPTENDVRAWVQVTGGGEGLPGLLAGLERARVEYAAWSRAYQEEGAAGVQEDIAAIEAASSRIAQFQPSLIPGLLQTPAYADAFLRMPCGPLAFGASSEDIDAMIAVRMRRHQALYDPGKKVTIVVGEAALRYRLVPAEVMAAQLDRLIDITTLPGVEFGVIPFAALLPVYPLSAFRLYDDLVIIESLAGEQQLSDPDEVARYERWLDLLQEAAVTGLEAVAVIRQALVALAAEG